MSLLVPSVYVHPPVVRLYFCLSLIVSSVCLSFFPFFYFSLFDLPPLSFLSRVFSLSALSLSSFLLPPLFVLSHIRPSCFSSLYIRLSYLFPSLTFSVTSVLLSLLSDVRLSQLKLPESQIFSPPLFNSSSFRGDCVGGGDHYSTLTCWCSKTQDWCCFTLSQRCWLHSCDRFISTMNQPRYWSRVRQMNVSNHQCFQLTHKPGVQFVSFGAECCFHQTLIHTSLVFIQRSRKYSVRLTAGSQICSGGVETTASPNIWFNKVMEEWRSNQCTV